VRNDDSNWKRRRVLGKAVKARGRDAARRGFRASRKDGCHDGLPPRGAGAIDTHNASVHRGQPALPNQRPPGL